MRSVSGHPRKARGSDLLALALFCSQTFSGFVRGTWAHWCVLTPCSPPMAVARWCSREIGVRLDRDFHHRLATVASDLHGVLVDVATDLRPPARDNPVCSRNFPLAWSRLWGLARWARPLCDRSVRVTRKALLAVFCAMPTTALSSTTSRRPTTPLETCGCNLVASLPAKLPLGLATLGSSTPSTWPTPRKPLRTHVRFVVHVCSQLGSPAW